MNKFINILLLLILFPVISFTIIVGFDIPLEFLKLSGANIPYKTEIFYSFAILFFLIGGRRSLKRWMGIRMVNQISRFQWNAPMGENRYKQSNLYLILEASLHFFMAFALYQISDLALPIVFVLFVLGLDHLFFALLTKSKNLYRVGITSKAIVVADRDLKVVYFSGLRKVDKQQQSLFFDYIKDLQVSFPTDCIDEKMRAEFKEKLASNLDRDRIFFSESFKSF
ncbi:MAG: hypothetical protein V4622_13200 [Bacteroidota bacterium]